MILNNISQTNLIKITNSELSRSIECKNKQDVFFYIAFLFPKYSPVKVTEETIQILKERYPHAGI